MSTKIEKDFQRVATYQKISNNLDVVREYFRHGDILVREVNDMLENMKNEIDGIEETAYVPQDFNDVLDLRDITLGPIFQSSSFIREFTKYQIDPPTL